MQFAKKMVLIYFVIFITQMENTFAQVISAMDVTGSICNQLNTSLSITPDGKAISVLFQEFQITYPLMTGRRVVPQITDMVSTDIHGENLQMVDYHYCLINLSVKEINEKIINVTVSGDARGLASIPKGFKGSYKIAVDHHTGLKTPSRARALIAKQYWQESDEDWTNTFSKKLNMVGSCQTNTKNIVIKVMLAMSKNKNATGDALLTMDSLDKTLSSIKLNFKTVACH